MSDHQDKPPPHTSFEDLIGLGNHSARKSYYPELVRKLDELEAERNRYKWLFENALHGIFQAGMSGGLRVANPAIARICGYPSAKDIVVQVTDIATQLFCCEEEFQRLIESLQADGSVLSYETRLSRADGSCVEVSMNVLLKKEHGESLIEAFVHDITERKKAQKALTDLNEALEGRVFERTQALSELNLQLWKEIEERRHMEQALKQARDIAQSANESKDRYLAAASHDLLQPMNAARLLVTTLSERRLKGDDGQLVERIQTALESAESLLMDLLDISRLDQNAVRAEPSAFSLDDLLLQMASEFQPVADKAGLRLRVRKTQLWGVSDSKLFSRVLRNLISNALRYTHSGGVLVGCRRLQNSVSVEVWDTGKGIPIESQAVIFQAFHQLDSHVAGERKGVGLGLAIVDRISRILNHSLTVKSVPGRGSLFRVSIPLADMKEVNTQERFSPVFLGSLQGITVLVVDNEPEILHSMKTLLEQWKAKVWVATNQAEVMQQLAQQRYIPDLLLADYHLDHGATGIELIQKLRAELGSLMPPCVLITAERSSECRQYFREQGIPVLYKPLKPGKLRALITHLLID